jgi:hypothetical protein
MCDKRDATVPGHPGLLARPSLFSLPSSSTKMSSSPTLCGFPSLPNELIRAIAGPKDLSALCQTNRQTDAICAIFSLLFSSTKMSRLCGFPSLPNELVHAIAGLCEPKDLSALCQTSRQTNAICLGWNYSVVSLDDPGKMVNAVKQLFALSCC